MDLIKKGSETVNWRLKLWPYFSLPLESQYLYILQHRL